MGYYDEICAGYEELHRQEQEAKLAIVFRELPFQLEPWMRLLDVGCGSGISMEPWDCEKTGIDPSPGLLAIAREKGLEVVEGTPEALPFADESFDLVISFTSLHHVLDIAACARELARVCKKWLIISYLKGADPVKREALLGELKDHFTLAKQVDAGKDIAYFLSKS